MPVAAMNHFTVLSDDLEATRRFYCDLFGFKVGWRPPFQFPGWWLYADDDTPILHFIHRDPLPKERAGVLDHMAFSAKDLPGTVETLKREGIEYELRRLPGGGIWQLFFNDPCGAKVEFDFNKDKPPPASLRSAPSPAVGAVGGGEGPIARRVGEGRAATPPLSHRAQRGGVARR